MFLLLMMRKDSTRKFSSRLGVKLSIEKMNVLGFWFLLNRIEAGRSRLEAGFKPLSKAVSLAFSPYEN
jgi:hypothetical protein